MGRPKKKPKQTKAAKAASLKMKFKKATVTSKTKVVIPKVKVEEIRQKPKNKNYQMYNQEDLIAAVKAVKEQGLSTYKAAEMYGVPKSTVHDKVVGKSNILFQRKGPPPLLSYEDEKKLVDYLLQMSNLGYMFSIGELRNLASELAVEKGKLLEGNLLSPRWHKSFRTRWPILNEKVFGNFRTCNHDKRIKNTKPIESYEDAAEDSIEFTTLSDETDACLSNYYEELHTLLVKYELLDKPHRIFTIDEVAIQYESGNPKTRPIKTLRNSVTSRTETTVVSLIGCGNALGNALPPFLIYPGAVLHPELLKGKYPGVQGTVTENGLTDYATVKYYLEEHFVKYALLGMTKKTPPIIVLYDGTKSKVNPDTIAWAKSHNIILFVLPPNGSNLTQPLERGCFRFFKDHFLRETRVYRELYNVDSICKTSICHIVCEAYPLAMSMKILVDIFEEMGIHPYKPSIVLNDDLRNERFRWKKKLQSITKRPPGMRDKGVQVIIKDDQNIKLIKSGRRKFVTQEDGTVTDVDSTSMFLRDKKIQKMLESSSSLGRKQMESDLSESEEEYDDIDEDGDRDEEIQPPTSGYYYVQGGTSQGGHNYSGGHTYSTAATQFKLENLSGAEFKIEEAHTYAMSPAAATSSNSSTAAKQPVISDIDTVEQTRVAVQALQDIANEIQLVTTTSVQNNGTIQNVTLNSGRMIQVVVQDPGMVTDQGSIEVQMEQQPDIEVEQIEIDNSVESILPMEGEHVIENT